MIFFLTLGSGWVQGGLGGPRSTAQGGPRSTTQGGPRDAKEYNTRGA